MCIKVDREERPDVDASTCRRRRLLARQGGWPMTVFATPDGRPFFAGTYFPPVSRGSMPGFADLCRGWPGLSRARRGRRGPGRTTSLGHMRRIAARQADAISPPRGLIETAVSDMVARFDHAQGGFGGAPKFPPSTVLEFLLASTRDPEIGGRARDGRRHPQAHGRAAGSVTRSAAASTATRSMTSGSFRTSRRCSTTTRCWRAPTSAPRGRPTTPAGERSPNRPSITCCGEMELPGGGFAAAQDADSPGGEGAFFVWTPDEIDALLPAEQARAIKRRFGVTTDGNFEGRTILHAALPLPLLADELGTDPAPLLAAATATLYCRPGTTSGAGPRRQADRGLERIGHRRIRRCGTGVRPPGLPRRRRACRGTHPRGAGHRRAPLSHAAGRRRAAPGPA